MIVVILHHVQNGVRAMSIEELLEYVRECMKEHDCCSCKYDDDCRGIMHLLGRVEIVLEEVLQNGVANN